MNEQVRKGFGFGITSGIITTLGMIIGLNFSTHSTLVVVGAILMIAIADSLSDALGIHISEESEGGHSSKEIWQATISTFFFKLVFALTFVVWFLFFDLTSAVYISIVWGVGLISLFSFYLGKQQKINPYKVIVEHLLIVIFVIVVTYFVGIWIARFFV